MDGDPLGGLRQHFQDLTDPRMAGKCDHRLLDIVVITILAVLCGADGWSEVELFGRLRHGWLQEFLELPQGIPSHDTFSRVFSLLDPKQFTAALVNWMAALQKASRGQVVSIDGKALRRSFAQGSKRVPFHLVSAWATANGLTLGQVAVEEGSNEIPAIKELLALLQLKDCTVTIDAIGCQQDIAAQIREQKADYVLALKNNQPKLAAALQDHFESHAETDFANVAHDQWATAETGHGRTEQRTYHALAVPADCPLTAGWKDLRSLAVVISQRIVQGHEQWEARFYLSSLPPKAKPLAAAIRRHWQVENGLHWVLDVAFREDDSRMRDRRATQNFAAVRRLAVSLLRQEKSTKIGAKGKRLKAALDPNYLLTVLNTG